MGHRAVTTTMGYVHVASSYMQPLAPEILAAGSREQDPDRRVVAMLGARGAVPIAKVRQQPGDGAGAAA